MRGNSLQNSWNKWRHANLFTGALSRHGRILGVLGLFDAPSRIPNVFVVKVKNKIHFTHCKYIMTITDVYARHALKSLKNKRKKCSRNRLWSLFTFWNTRQRVKSWRNLMIYNRIDFPYGLFALLLIKWYTWKCFIKFYIVKCIKSPFKNSFLCICCWSIKRCILKYIYIVYRVHFKIRCDKSLRLKIVKCNS